MTDPSPTNKKHISPIHEKMSTTKRVLVSRAEQPHQVMTAGQAISFVFLTVIIGMILNSSSLYIKASGMKPSWQRSVSMKILRPFDLTMRATGITSVRQVPRYALDLGRDDEVDTFVFNKIAQPTAPPVTTTLPTLTPENKLSTWIVGDSLSITPGESIMRIFPTSAFDIKGMSGQVSTGLARPDVFNWFTHINDFVVNNHPQLIIITFGANDDQYLYSDSGPIGPFGSEAWRAQYATRVGSTLDFLANQGVYTIWIAIPPVRDPVRNDRYQIINDVVRTSVSARPATASYIETKKAFTNPDGTYSDSPLLNGTPTLLRAQDGIHFTRAGGDVIANLVLTKLHTLYQFQ